MEETGPGLLDDQGRVYHRRRAHDERLDHIANSSLLKVIQYIVTAIAVPLIGWSLNTVLDRMGNIEKAVREADKSTATYELRLLNVERANLERDTTMRLLTEKVIGHDYEIKALGKRP